MRNLQKIHKRKIKKFAKNEFSKISGQATIQLTGNSNCLVTRQATANGLSIQRYSYERVYNDFSFDLSNSVRVTTICGVNQCVKKEHLKATFYPKEEDKGYLESFGKNATTEEQAHYLGIPVDVLKVHLLKR